MTAYLDHIAAAFARKRSVSIADCVHPCAYRYGRGETNPYEQYIRGLAAGVNQQTMRGRFVEYVRCYRPKHLGEALGIELSRPYPLWYLPWRKPARVMKSPGWCDSAAAVVDIMTYFAAEGIPRRLIEMEFNWHENAFASIAAHGYRPQRYGYIMVREMRAARSAYFVTDGNHRLSAISAVGGQSVIVKMPASSLIVRANADRWPLVQAGMMTLDDALAVFDVYLVGNLSPARSGHPADIIA